MHISIIDDEKILTSKISKKLKLNGYGVSEYYSYLDFMSKRNDFMSDLYIIDISLGDGTGFDIIKMLKEKKKTLNSRIIIISGYGDIDKKIFGLDLGADDYLTKPFLPDELIARIRAVFRRSDKFSIYDEMYYYNNITLNKKTGEIFKDGEEIILTKKEYLMFELFISNKGKIVEKNKLLNYVWGTQSIDVTENTLNVTLSRLRKKFNDDFNVETKYNFGYILL